jgi:transcriptional regulator with XRE-family HTH domain
MELSRFSRALGEELRKARRAQRLTLEHMRGLSGDLFKPSALASYERGERRISAERLCVLAGFYGSRGDVLLAAALNRLGDDSLRQIAVLPSEVTITVQEPSRQEATLSGDRSDREPPGDL